MIELYTALTVFLPTAFTFAVAAHSPRDAAGNKITRSNRTFGNDVRSFLRLATY